MALVVGEGVVLVTPDMTRFQKQVASNVKTASAPLRSSFAGLGRALGITFGVAMAVQIGRASLDAFDTIRSNTARLSGGLKKIGPEASASLGSVLDWAKDFSSRTGVLQGDILDITSKLAAMGTEFFRAVGPNADRWLERIASGLTDMAAQTGKSAGLLMRSLGPALLNAPEKAIPSLVKYGVITDEQVAKIKQLIAEGHKQAATQLEITAIQQKYAGAAARAATAQDHLKVVWNNIEAAIGRVLDVGARLLVWFFGASKVASTLRDIILALAIGVGLYALALNAASIAETVALVAMYALDAAMAINPFALIAAAIVIAAVLIIRNWSAVKSFLISTWHRIVAVAVTAWHALYKALSFTPIMSYIKLQLLILRTIFRVAFAAIRAVISVAAAAWRNVIGPAVRGVLGVVRTVLHTLRDVWNTVWGGLSGPVTAIMNTVQSIVRTGLNVVIGIINGLIRAYNLLPGHTTIPHLARGGTVTQSGMALVGEGGAQEIYAQRGASVIPLDRLPVDGVGGGRRAVTLVVDGREFPAYLEEVADGRIAQERTFRTGTARMGTPA